MSVCGYVTCAFVFIISFIAGCLCLLPFQFGSVGLAWQIRCVYLENTSSRRIDLHTKQIWIIFNRNKHTRKPYTPNTHIHNIRMKRIKMKCTHVHLNVGCHSLIHIFILFRYFIVTKFCFSLVTIFHSIHWIGAREFTHSMHFVSKCKQKAIVIFINYKFLWSVQVDWQNSNNNISSSGSSSSRSPCTTKNDIFKLTGSIAFAYEWTKKKLPIGPYTAIRIYVNRWRESILIHICPVIWWICYYLRCSAGCWLSLLLLLLLVFCLYSSNKYSITKATYLCWLWI